MERVETPDTSLRSVYLPHHPVFKEGSQTSHLLVVFNASSIISNGNSLNDHLLSGPKLQQLFCDGEDIALYIEPTLQKCSDKFW